MSALEVRNLPGCCTLGSKSDNRCTSCGSLHLRRSRTRTWERPLRLLLLRPYRCRDCEHRQYHSISEGTFFPGPPHASVEWVRKANGKKWMLYGLFICLLVSAIVMIRLGNTLLVSRSLNALRSSLVQPANKALDIPREHETASAKSAPVEGSQARHEATTEAPPSVQSLEPHTSVSPDEVTSSSSSAEPIRAAQPKLPAHIQGMITSDNSVEVRVRIDRSGRVIGVKVISTSGPVATSLVRYAVATAGRWRFRPALQKGKRVPSESSLKLPFRPSGNLVARAEDSAR